MDQRITLLIIALLAVIGLVVMIARFKLPAFVSLILASLFVGVCSGLPLLETVKSFQEGVGAILGSITIVVGLGTILGKLLAESGGAEVIAETLIKAFGKDRIHWTIMLVAFVVGLPVWFSVGLVLLVPIVFTIAKETKTPLLFVGIPLLAGLSVSHGLVPPHPGPMVAVDMLNADPGKTILLSLIIGLPTAIIAGPIFSPWRANIGSKLDGSVANQLSGKGTIKSPPTFIVTVGTILIPIILMLIATAGELYLAKDGSMRQVTSFLGSPLVALLLAFLCSLYTLGIARGFGKQELLRFSEECLGPIALVLLVVGAGGGFNRVLVKSGVGEAIAGMAGTVELPPLLFGWLIAALIRISTGSATVAISTAAGIMAPIVGATPGVNVELLVIAMGAGSLILSHLNDGGFWFVKEYFGLTVGETLRTWTVMETIIAIVALVFAMLLDFIL